MNRRAPGAYDEQEGTSANDEQEGTSALDTGHNPYLNTFKSQCLRDIKFRR